MKKETKQCTAHPEYLQGRCLFCDGLHTVNKKEIPIYRGSGGAKPCRHGFIEGSCTYCKNEPKLTTFEKETMKEFDKLVEKYGADEFYLEPEIQCRGFILERLRSLTAMYRNQIEEKVSIILDKHRSNRYAFETRKGNLEDIEVKWLNSDAYEIIVQIEKIVNEVLSTDN